MGFQVAALWYSLRSEPVPFEGTVYAGPPQTAICTPYVHLTAVVTGSLSGHTTLWEQISGDPVSFIGLVTGTLTISYTHTNQTDKIFRFWVDKGLDGSQYADVTIYSTITDKFLTTDKTVFGKLTGLISNTYTALSVGGSPAPELSEVSSAGTSAQNGNSILVYWKLSAIPSFVEVYENSTGVFNLVATLDQTDQQSYIGNKNNTYKITAYYKNGGVTQQQVGAPVRFAIENNVHITDKVRCFSTDQKPQLITTLTSRTKINQPVQDSLVSAVVSDFLASQHTVFTTRTLLKPSVPIEAAPNTLVSYMRVADAKQLTVLKTRLSIGG